MATAPVAMDFPAEEVVFELDGLSCYYGSFRAVRDISLKVPRGYLESLTGVVEPDELPDARSLTSYPMHDG